MSTPAGPSALLLAHGQVDSVRRLATVHGRQVRLTTMEAALLQRLARDPGVTVTREQLLVEVWGYAPTSTSRTVDVTVRRLRAKIEPDPHAPRHLLTVHGAGYSFVPASAPTQAPDGGSLDPDPPDDGPGPVLVESRDMKTIGRAADLQAALDALHAGAGPLTLAGPAGVGKTHLARALAVQASANGDPARFVDLVAARTADDVAIALATALGLDRATDATLIAAMARPGLLLVLDNFEQLPPSAAERLSTWLDAAPDARVVVTSRRPLGLPREQVMRVAPLPPHEAEQLFRLHAARSRPDAPLDHAHLQQVVRWTDGLPLALELAAARLRVLSLAELAERIDLSLMRDRNPKRPDRASLAQALDASWALLSDDARTALVSLSALPGACLTPLALRFLDDVGCPDPLSALEELAEHSLVRVEEGPPGTDTTRLAPFVCIAAYAAGRAQAPPGAAWIEALADVLEEEAAALDGRTGRRARLRLLAESELVLAALREAAASPTRIEQRQAALRAASAFFEAVTLAAGHPADLAVLDQAVALAREVGDVERQAMLLTRRIKAHDRVGAFPLAVADADAVAALLHDRPELLSLRIEAEANLAGALRRVERPAEALAILERLPVDDGLPTRVAAMIHSERGLALVRLTRLDEAVDALFQSHALAEAGGDVHRADAALAQLALAHVELGHGAALEPRVQAALEREQTTGSGTPALLLWWYVLGAMALEDGRLDDAAHAFQVELDTARAIGRPSTVATGTMNLGLVALRRGDVAGALSAFSAAREAYRPLTNGRLPAAMSVALVMARIGAGQVLTAPEDELVGHQDSGIDAQLLELGRAALAWQADPVAGRDLLLDRARAARRAPNVDLRELGRYALSLLGESPTAAH